MQKSTIDCTTDEIDLLDIIKQLWQGRWVVFCTTLLCLLIAVSYLMLATPKWIATVTVNKPYLNQLANYPREGANKRGNSSRLTQSFHFFMFEPIFSPVNALNQPI
ncbi:Wzz/FepE/Etk N-terminal domain-containing protein [Edwardsiella tarda]|uniref:Wzz/FepE/Etk N-terminal domain-containing protein n=1 Tax=Edwardsiella tarda TaxID=636 RepID=UPI00351CAFAE